MDLVGLGPEQQRADVRLNSQRKGCDGYLPKAIVTNKRMSFNSFPVFCSQCAGRVSVNERFGYVHAPCTASRVPLANLGVAATKADDTRATCPPWLVRQRY